MKRLLATIAVAGAVAGCGSATGSQNTAQHQCAKYRAQARTWAQNFVAPLPADVAQVQMPQVMESQYKLLATTHGLTCN